MFSEDYKIKENEYFVNVFNKILTKFPDRQILNMEDEKGNIYSYTRNQLDVASRCFYAYLKDHMINQDTTVALIFDNRFKLVVSILTCIRFGIIFTIIGKDNPLNKSIYQIKDSNSNYIITDKKLEEDLISAVSEVINYDEAIKYNKKQEQLQNMNLDDIACICYTSGTTGDSKGIPIIYGAITNASISHSKIRSWEYNKQLTSAVSAKETFIVFLYTLLTYIYMGSTIYITNNEETTNYSLFLDFLIKNKIDDTFFPPTMVDYYLNNVNNPFLKNIFTGGDKVKLTKLNDSVNVSVIYGLTETFAGSTSYKIDSLDKSLCIGKPFLNTQLFVLDNEYNQCDNNQIGQIALSGIQNSNFYINNDEETKKHFIDNPYSSKYTIYNSYYDKIFLTGDYGYIGDDGNLYFASRKDNQVQIRGKRVEINEITTVLDQIKEVSKSYVLAKQDNDDETYLTCFYVSDTLSESGLRDILNDELVDYMVPSFIVKLDEMPLNVHHKIDVKKLEQIEYKIDKIIHPTNDIEVKLTEAFCEILDVDNVSIEDNFFQIGGNSNKAVKLVSKAREKGVFIEVRDVMEYLTVKSIAEHAKILESDDFVETVENLQLNLEPKESLNIYNKKFLFMPVHCSKKDMHKVLDYIFQYYSILRAKFSNDTLNIAPYQKDDFVLESVEIPLSDVSSFIDDVNLLDNQLVKSYYLSTEKENYLLIVISDVLVDNNSLDILLENIEELINLQANNEELHLSDDSIVFLNFFDKLNEYRDDYEVENEAMYWNNLLSSVECVNLSEDNFEDEDDFNLLYVPIELDLYDKNIYKPININVEQLIISAFSYAISEATDEEDIALTIKNHNRDKLDEPINIINTVGNFEYYYPINIHVDNDLKDHIIEVKDNTNNVPNNGIGYSINPNINKEDCDLDILFDYNKYNKNIEGIINILGNDILEKLYKDKYLSYDYDLILNVVNFNGKMTFKFFYRNIDDDIVEEIADLFNETLTDMVSIVKSSNKIRTITDFIRNNYKGLTKLNDGDENINPLFLLYPAFGNSTAYVHLTQKINKKIPVYAIEPLLYNGISKPIEGIENLANEHIKVIKQYQKHGPYNLLGSSYGGLLAFEIAIQLKKEGETINNIYLLDSQVYNNKDSNKENLDLSSEDKEEGVLAFWLSFFYEKYGDVLNAGSFLESLTKTLEDIENNLEREKDMKNYKPNFYNGKIKLFKSLYRLNLENLDMEEISSEELKENYYNGFDSCVDKKNIEVYESKCTHFSMCIDDEFLKFLSKIIEEDYNLS